ncbi:hypothetical protein CRM22_001700 [Opisthorchis felineus]|uniref:Protein RER1 n=1 Tax=Opisthorchis felineus TaxID=147828 RepID=A0A4S2M9I7_OPIFE|nr:hypothetical protein CRM22_001700 [Opisthorchis felineus]
MELEKHVDSSSSSFLSRIFRPITVMHQSIIDKLAPHRVLRWFIALVFLTVYVLRVVHLQGFHIISYALAIYLLGLFIAAISPKVDPAFAEVFDETPTLPRTEGEEFRPFIPRLLESKFWLSTVRAILISIFCTFFPFLDLPVFWPILVLYFTMLFTLMMKRQIKHMIKYRYVPFSYGKPKHTGNNNKETRPSSDILNS